MSRKLTTAPNHQTSISLMLPEGKKCKKISLVSLLPPRKYKLSSISVLAAAQTQHKTRKWTQVVALLPVYLLQICYGMNSGFPAILTPQLREDCSEFSITVDQESWLVSLDNLLTPLVCLLSGPMQQRWGPRTVLMLCCFPYFLSWLLTTLATNHEILYLARILVGVSHALLSTSVYTIEVSSTDMRGTYSVLESVLRCFGCVTVYILGLFYRWQDISILALAIPVLGLAASFFSPESPVYLVSREKYQQAEESLKRLYGPEYCSQQETLLISLQKLQQNKTRKAEYLKNFRSHPELYKPLIIVIILSIIQQFSGVSVIRAYVVKIFDEVFSRDVVIPVDNGDARNFTNVTCMGDVQKTSRLAYFSAITIGLFRLVASLTLARLLINYKRRLMYHLSLTLSIVFLGSFSLFSYLSQDPSASIVYRWSSLVSACCLVFSVQLGVQTLPFLLSGELFPSDVRAICKGLTRSWTCILLVVSLKLFPHMEAALTLSGTFLTFGLVLVLFLPLIFFILPETKDLSLDTIQHYFLSDSFQEEAASLPTTTPTTSAGQKPVSKPVTGQ